MVDAQGHDSLQIFRRDRPLFVSGDKTKGTPAEYSAAVKGTSTHFETVSVDPVAHILTFPGIERDSRPDAEARNLKIAGTSQFPYGRAATDGESQPAADAAAARTPKDFSRWRSTARSQAAKSAD